MGWRFYAQRATTGVWLHTNVPMSADLTWAFNDTDSATGFVPDAFDQGKMVDGEPLWKERGTYLYAEEDRELKWFGLCSFQRAVAAGREVEFAGLMGALDLMGYGGRIREWQPDPFDIVQQLVSHAQHQPDGDLGFDVRRDGQAPTYAGDEEPPSERPRKVKRRRGESKEDFADREEDRAKAQEQWDKDYADREPYLVAWWEAPYIGEEIRELAREIPFDWNERVEWANRGNLERRSELVLSPRKGRQRSDIALVEGINLAEVVEPQTATDRYGNHLVGLGAGEGRRMRRAEIARRDGRIRTTRYLEAKHVHQEKRLQAKVRDRFDRMHVALDVDQAMLRGDTGALEPGDTVRIASRLFTGWCRVQSLTRSTRTGNVTLTFTTQ